MKSNAFQISLILIFCIITINANAKNNMNASIQILGQEDAPDAIPAGMLLFFMLPQCPPGWSEVVEAQGRYIVALSPGGTNRATVGIALANQENRSVGQHTHDIYDTGHQHMYSKRDSATASCHWGPNIGTTYTIPYFPPAQTTGITINYTNSTEGTNAPYIQLSLCMYLGEPIKQKNVDDHTAANGEQSSDTLIISNPGTDDTQRTSFNQEFPTDAIMFFNSQNCPYGWEEVDTLRGRYFVALPPGGGLGDSVGIALSDKENRPDGRHSHLINDPGHSHGGIGFLRSCTYESGSEDCGGCPSVRSCTKMDGTWGKSPGIQVLDSGVVDGTNAPYIQFIACRFANLPCDTEPLFAGLKSAKSAENPTCKINLAYDAATTDCSIGVTYHVYRSTDPDFVPSSYNRIASCITATTYSDFNVKYGVTYYYIVRAEDGTDDSTGPCNSGNIDTNVIKRSASPYSTDWIVFSDDFETDLNNWDITGDWNLSDLTAYDGTSSVYSGNNNNQCDTLTLKNSLNPPVNSGPLMTFWTYYRMQNGYDGGIVEASSNGTNWEKVQLVPVYPGITNITYACIGSQQSCFTGDGAVWTEYSADLSSYVGNTMKIRFRYGSDASLNIRGWFIDDVKIQWTQACVTITRPPGTVPDNDNFAGNPLVISKSVDDLFLQWGIPGGGCMTEDYGIYQGTLPWQGYNHTPVTCTTNGLNSVLISPSSGSYYYLVVAQNKGKEGSYGLDSSNTQRPVSSVSCFPQQIGNCN